MSEKIDTFLNTLSEKDTQEIRNKISLKQFKTKTKHFLEKRALQLKAFKEHYMPFIKSTEHIKGQYERIDNILNKVLTILKNLFANYNKLDEIQLFSAVDEFIVAQHYLTATIINFDNDNNDSDWKEDRKLLNSFYKYFPDTDFPNQKPELYQPDPPKPERDYTDHRNSRDPFDPDSSLGGLPDLDL